MSDGGDFSFNDEFFLKPADLARLKQRFPLVAFAFHCPRASELLVGFDAAAKRAKGNFQRYGFATVVLALLALLIAAADPVFVVPAVESQELPAVWAKVIAFVAALFGILAAAIGWAGLGIGAKRHEWLKNRIICERLRQWQSQYICAHVPEILAAARSEAARSAYLADRDASLAQFQADHITNVGARLTSLLHPQPDNPPPLWVANDLARGATARREATAADDQPAEQQLFEAFDEIRFRGQVEYAEYLRGPGGLRTHPHTQHQVLWVASYVTITVILGLHLLVIVGVLNDIPELKHPLVHFLAIAAALIGLSIRVLEDGLRPAVHVSRMESYLQEVVRARARFRKADAPADKIAQMRVFEEAAAVEMIGFLKAAASARYVL